MDRTWASQPPTVLTRPLAHSYQLQMEIDFLEDPVSVATQGDHVVLAITPRT